MQSLVRRAPRKEDTCVHPGIESVCIRSSLKYPLRIFLDSGTQCAKEPPLQPRELYTDDGPFVVHSQYVSSLPW